MSSFPFYSPVVRKALVDIISNHEDFAAQVSLSLKINDDDVSSFNLHTTNNSNAGDNLRVGGTTAIRGKWRGGYASSSSDDEAADKEDDDASNTSGSDDDGSTSSSVCSPSLGAVGENEKSKDTNNIVHEEQRTIAVQATATNKEKQQSKKKKKHKNKNKAKDMVTKMGKAPSILLPYDNNKEKRKNDIGSSDKRVLEVPNVLLPINYINDNPSYHVSSMAKTLLSTWEALNDKTHPPTIIVVLLQSGRFASAVFTLQQSPTNNSTSKNNNNNDITMQMIAHKTSTRYTVRKGQGGAQSSHDQGKHKAKSIGAQLRREGEKQLRSDVHETWIEWNKLGYIDKALNVYVSCPKGMKRDYLHINDGSSGLLKKNDARWRSVPLDVGRPTLEATSAVLDCVLSCHLRDMTEEELAHLAGADDEKENATKDDGEKKTKKLPEQSNPEEKEVAPPPPFTPVHEAVMNGDLSRLLELLTELDESEQQQVDETSNIDQPAKISLDYDVNTCGGPDNQTALHLAASSTCSNATSLINALLIQGHANPCVIDARMRPPYFLANSDKHREAFRLARGSLGEDYCPWDDGAIGPALSEDDVQIKKAKALEKKRRQRARQKEKKAIEKAEAEAVATKERAELEKKKQEEDAKRIRDGLKPKPKAQNACDFCHKIVKGKRRSQMFQRLEYAYCSTDCVKKHQRELTAAAAVARFSNH